MRKVVVPVATASNHNPYNADIELLDPTTMRVAYITLASGRRQPSQKSINFFPDMWTEAQVEAAIQDAFRDAYKNDMVAGRRFEGVGDGVNIEGYVDGGGSAVASAWPKI